MTQDRVAPPLTEPSVDVVIRRSGGKFMAVRLAASRARALGEYLTGSLGNDSIPPQVQTTTSNPLSIALEEIARGKVEAVQSQPRTSPTQLT